MIVAESYTDCGGRQYNEDKAGFGRKAGIFCAVIADGLGGHGGGGLASEAAVQTVSECLKYRDDAAEPTEIELAGWFAEANKRVLGMQTQECQMRTTLAVLCIDKMGKRAIIAHLGDSRIYHFVNGKCISCTFDHSVSRMAVLAGEITMEEIRFHADRNKLLKVIGKSREIKAETEAVELAEKESHAFLLCTDGFWEYVMEEEMEKDLEDTARPGEWLAKMRKRLEGRVKEKNDNNSAIAVFVVEDGR